jgi:hypothetical protein
MMPKDEFLEHVHDRIAQIAKAQLRDALAVLHALARHDAGNSERLGQGRIDVDVQ